MKWFTGASTLTFALLIGGAGNAEEVEQGDRTETIVIVQQGEVRVGNENGEVTVGEDEEARATADGAPVRGRRGTTRSIVSINGNVIELNGAGGIKAIQDGDGIKVETDGKNQGGLIFNGKRLGGFIGEELKIELGDDGVPRIFQNGKEIRMGGDALNIEGPLGEKLVVDSMRRAKRLMRGLDTKQMRMVLDWIDEVSTGRALAELNEVLEDEKNFEKTDTISSLVSTIGLGVEKVDLRRLEALGKKLDEETTYAQLKRLVERLNRAFQDENAPALLERAQEFQELLGPARIGGRDVNNMIQRALKGVDLNDIINNGLMHRRGRQDGEAEEREAKPEEKEVF